MFGELDRSGVKPFHIKNILVSGIGVFSDSYNLYAISLVNFQLSYFLGLSNFEKTLVTASSFYGAALGAIVFGLIADRIGRKPMYGIDLALIFIGAFSQLFINNFSLLFISRIILGFGIGGDYVMSPVIMAENSNVKDRGKLMATAFSVMYLLGAVLAAFVAQMSSIFLVHAISWKVVLAFGAVPSLFVIYYRRSISETYRFSARVKGDTSEAARNSWVSQDTIPKVGKDETSYMQRLIGSLPFVLVGAVLWILYDTYSSTFTIYGPITIAANLGLSPVQFTYAAVFLAGLPGTIISLLLIDRIGRKKLVTIGYAGVFVGLLLYSLLLMDPSLFGVYGSDGTVKGLAGFAAVLGFTFYLFNYLSSAMGPATIIGGTIIVPEMLPTKVRATGQSINVSLDRVAEGLAITSFPLLLETLGLGVMVLVYGVIALASSVIMYRLLPETRGRTLEDISHEDSGDSSMPGR